MRSPFKYWLLTALSGFILIGLGLAELMVRRASAPNFYLLNKSIACTALLFIALSYALRPILMRWLSNPLKYKKGLLFRRPLGILGFCLALIHSALSLLVRDPNTPQLHKFIFPAYFLDNWPAFFAAAVAFVSFAYLFKISIWNSSFRTSATQAQKWRKHLQIGFFSLLLAFMHAALLKYQGWIKWLNSFDPTLPPLSLIALAIVLFLIVLKIKLLLKNHQKATQKLDIPLSQEIN